MIVLVKYSVLKRKTRKFAALSIWLWVLINLLHVSLCTEGATLQTFLVFQDVFKMSWRRLQRNTFRLPRPLEDVFKTHLQYVFLKRLQDVFKTCLRDVLQLCLQDVFASRLAIMSSRRLGRQKNVTLKTSSVRLHRDECLLGTETYRCEAYAHMQMNKKCFF